MKIYTNKKRILISLVILLSLLLLILLNYKAFIVNESFRFLKLTYSILLSVISCIFFSIKIELKGRLNSAFTIISCLLSILSCYIIVELLNKNLLFSIYFKRLLFNFIIIVFLHLLIYAITNKINISIILSNSIVFILGTVNYTVTCFRGTPLVPWDILSIKTAAYVASNYTFSFSYYLLLAISFFSLIISIGLKVKHKTSNKKLNYIIRFIILSVICFFTIIFYKTNVINYFNFETNLWEPTNEYLNNGFLASFIKQSKNLFNDKPNNYSIETVENILNTYINDDSLYTYNNNPDSPNIIVIMSESFADLSVNGDFNTSDEYMSYFKSLKENTIRGNTYVSVFGGQTPNSEWEFLTNNSMAFMPYRTVPYQQYIRRKSHSLATILKSQGYTANAIHPWYGSGYRRNAVYPLIGFDTFETIETLNDLEYLRCYPTDLSTYKYLTNQFENKSSDEKIFDFVVTMQNHSSYDLAGYNPTISLIDLDDCRKVEQYMSIMKESDAAFEYLINYFKNFDEKTIILFFGDHQPADLEDKFWETIMTDTSNETTKYITPFVLWANYDIEEQYIDKISLNYLSILLLDVAELNSTPYMDFLKDIQSKIPVITGNGYIDTEGNYYTLDSENEYSDILSNYQLVQYNNVFDYKNRVNHFFEIAQ